MVTKYDLTRIATRREREMVKAFNESINNVRDNATLKEIDRLISRGDIEAVLSILQLSEATFSPVIESIRQSFIIGGNTGAEQVGTIPLSDGSLVARFDANTPDAQAWIQRSSSRMVVEIIEPQREMLRQVLVDGLAKGDNPRRTALDIIGRVGQNGRRQGGFIGLTEQQAGWVKSAREELENLDPNYLNRALRDGRFDPSIRRAIENGTPLPQKTIDSAITNMQNRAQRYRGEVIGRTESIDALRSGQWQSIQQAADNSDIPPETIKVWDATGDVRTRTDHGLADNQERALDQPFNVGGSLLMFPGDRSLDASASQTIQCRCQAVYRVKWGSVARRIDGFG